MFLPPISYVERHPRARAWVCISGNDSGAFTLNLTTNMRETGLVREDTNTLLGMKLSGFRSQLFTGVAWELAGIWGLWGPMGSYSHLCTSIRTTNSMESWAWVQPLPLGKTALTRLNQVLYLVMYYSVRSLSVAHAHAHALSFPISEKDNDLFHTSYFLFPYFCKSYY